MSSADDLVLEEPSRAVPVAPPPIPPAAPAFEFGLSPDLAERGSADASGAAAPFEFGAPGTDLSEPPAAEPVPGLEIAPAAWTVPGAVHFAGVDPFDHLVITAHASSVVTGAIAPLAEMTVAAARAYMETKFWGPFMAAKHGRLRLAPRGSMVFFSGAAGARKLLPNHTAIGATNGAVEAFARRLVRYFNSY